MSTSGAKRRVLQFDMLKKDDNSPILFVAAWFGLVAGLVEGVGLLAVFGYGWLGAHNNLRAGVSVEIIWISALFDLGWFLLLGSLGMCVQKTWPRLHVTRILIPAFVFVACVDWLALSARLSPVSVLTLAAGIAVAFNRWFRRHELLTLNLLRRTLPAVVAITILCFIGIEGATWLRERSSMSELPPAAPASPNVLVVVVDTLRADHLPLYGYRRSTSPNLDALAKRGVVFDNDIAPSSWTLPSHASMLTGRYPHDHGVDHEVRLGAQYPTLPEVLEQHGYRTGGFSANLFYFTRRAGLGRGFVHFCDYFYSVEDMFFRTLWGRVLNRYLPNSDVVNEYLPRKSAREVNREVLDWIDHDRDRPFFAFINYFDVHGPYMVRSPARQMFFGTQTKDTPPVIDRRIDRDHDPYLFRLSRMPAVEFQHQIDAYDGAIHEVDQQFANLFSELQKRGLTENTLVVITSDHGESFGDHGLLEHWNALYRELIQVPLIYYWPGKIPGGVRISKTISGASLPATVLDLVGIKSDASFPVPSVAQLWQRPEVDPEWPDPLAEMAQNLNLPLGYPAYQGWLKAIVSTRWHLIVSERLSPELYDWAADPEELHNRAANGNEEAFKAMSTELWREVASGSPNDSPGDSGSPVSALTK
jgi:arylsulfatase A-like enzyme